MVGRITSGDARGMMATGCVRIAGSHVVEEGLHVVEEIARHHRRRDRRVADHLAGKDLGVGARKNRIDAVEEIDDIAVVRRQIDAEFLIAIDRPDQHALVRCDGQPAGKVQVGDVAHHPLTLVAEALGRCPADDRGQGGLQRPDQVELLCRTEMRRGQPPGAVPGSDGAVGGNIGVIRAVIGNQHLDGPGVGEAALLGQQAVQAGANMLRPVGDRNDDDDPMRFHAALSGRRDRRGKRSCPTSPR